MAPVRLSIFSALLLSACAPSWSTDELALMSDLRLERVSTSDPSNRFSTNDAAARLGQRFFFEARFSSNGEVSCATCHDPKRDFQDGTALAKGVGTTGRRTMPLSGVAAGSWFFWDGRKDSLWSQALGPLESAVEHGGDRLQYARVIATHYRPEYEAVFGALPELSGLPEHATPNGSIEAWEAWQALPEAKRVEINRVFVNLGKALAAYEQKLRPGETRFDRYVDAVQNGTTARGILDADELGGLRLFVGKARCTECHNGPQLTNHDFANTGVPQGEGLANDLGREAGAREVLQDEFNCLSIYSDAKPEACRELAALRPDEHMLRQFKVPSLRNVAERAPYMHAGQFKSLGEVLAHYNRAPAAPAGETQLHPLGLNDRELVQLERFLQTLSAPLDAEPEWLSAPAHN